MVERYSNPENNKEAILELEGRVLYLAKDSALIRRQIEGEDLPIVPQDQLADNVSTDEIIPSKYCLYSTSAELGEFALTGFRGGVIKPGDIKKGNFDVIVVGSLFGGGSAREHAPISLKGAGIRFVAGTGIERIFLANSQNQGLYPIINQEILERFLIEKTIDKTLIAENLDPISASIVRYGGLLPYLEARSKGSTSPPEVDTDPKRAMTMVEKIIARHWIVKNGEIGVPTVKPGDVGFVKVDFSYSYEIMTPLAEAILKEYFGDSFSVVNRENIVLFEDHLALFESKEEDWKERQRQVSQVSNLISAQRRFAKEHGILRYSPDVGICHNKVAEKHALPGKVITSTDSHACSEGSLGSFSNGIGVTEMAGAWITGDVRVIVPETWRFNFRGKLGENVMAKDVMLFIFAKSEFQRGEAVGKVLEYTGEGLSNLSFDELFVLPNMAVEGGAFTGIVEPNGVVVEFLLRNHPELSRQQIEKMLVLSDSDADFEKIFDIDLTSVPLMVASPGNPKNVVYLSEVAGAIMNTVYLGSCTGGKLEDLKKAAGVFKPAKNGKIRKVKIPTFIQASSGEIRAKAESLGIMTVFRNAGAQVIDVGCGDCCNLGFGITEPGGNVCSDTNRNFPGRMGNNNVHLVNPVVAAAAAILGRLPTPTEIAELAKAV